MLYGSLKFGSNLLSLKAPGTLSKINDIAGVAAGVYEDDGNFLTGASVLHDILYCLHIL